MALFEPYTEELRKVGGAYLTAAGQWNQTDF